MADIYTLNITNILNFKKYCFYYILNLLYVTEGEKKSVKCLKRIFGISCSTVTFYNFGAYYKFSEFPCRILKYPVYKNWKYLLWIHIPFLFIRETNKILINITMARFVCPFFLLFLFSLTSSFIEKDKTQLFWIKMLSFTVKLFTYSYTNGIHKGKKNRKYMTYGMSI